MIKGMRLHRAVCLTAVALALSGCSVSAPSTVDARPDPAQRYADPAGRFTVVPPNGWTAASPPPDQDARFVGVSNDPTRAPTLDVSVVELPTNLATYVDETRPTAELTVDRPATLSDGTPAHLFGWVTSGDQGRPYSLENRRLQAVGEAGRVAVTITAWGDDWDRFGTSALEESLLTLQVPPKPRLGEPYRDPQNRFEITVPDSWEAAPTVGDEAVRFVDPTITSTSALPHATFTVRAVPWTGDLAAVQTAKRPATPAGPASFRLDDGTPAVGLSGGGPVGISMSEVVAVADGLAVVATTQVGSDVYDSYRYGDLADTTLHRMVTSLIVTP